MKKSQPVASEVPKGAVCAECENAPATRRLSGPDGEIHVCETCFQDAFERGLPRDPEPLDGLD